MARLYWSLCWLILPTKVSGAAYSGVTPPISPELLWRSRCLTRPKSATLTRLLKMMPLVHVVEGFGRISQVAQQLIARDADKTRRDAFLIDVVERAFRQLHDDDELPFDDFDAVEGADEGMADFLDALQGLPFLL